MVPNVVVTLSVIIFLRFLKASIVVQQLPLGSPLEIVCPVVGAVSVQVQNESRPVRVIQEQFSHNPVNRYLPVAVRLSGLAESQVGDQITLAVWTPFRQNGPGGLLPYDTVLVNRPEAHAVQSPQVGYPVEGEARNLFPNLSLLRVRGL